MPYRSTRIPWTLTAAFACTVLLFPVSVDSLAKPRKAKPPTIVQTAIPVSDDLAPDTVIPPIPAIAEPAAIWDCAGIKHHLNLSVSKVLGGYSVAGNNGKFVCQVASRKGDPKAIKDPGESRRLTAADRGEYQDRQLVMPQTTAKLQAIVDKIAAQYPYPKPARVEVRIVGTSVYQAEALSDDSIKIHLGLLTTGKSESEIAYVLAHEYAHIALGHLNRNDDIAGQNRLISTVSDAYYYGVKLSQQRWTEIGSRVVFSPADANKIVGARQEAEDASQRLHLVLDVFVTPVWKRSQEDEADALGYDLATKAGYDTETGPGVVFIAMAASEGEQRALVDQLSNDVDTSLKKAADLQTQAIATRINSNNINAEMLDATGHGLWTTFNSAIRENGLKTLKAVFTRTHRSPEDRRAGLSAYTATAYGDGGDLPTVPKWLAATKAEKEYSDAAIAVAAVDASEMARIASDIPQARAQVNKALKTRYRNSPMVLNEQARVLIRENRPEEANRIFLTAHKSPFQSVIAYQDHVELMLELRQWESAKTLANEASIRFKDNRPFLADYVAIAFASGQQDEGVKQLKACMDTDKAQLKQTCVNSAPYPDTPEFKRLSPTNQEQVMLARGKVNDKNMVDKASNAFSSFLSGMRPKDT